MDMHPEVKGNDRYGLPPQLIGDIYCSPWCGGGCTKAAHDKAVTDAAELAKRMGPGWLPVVWENLGWFCKVEKGGASVYLDRQGEYSVIFRSAVCVTASASTPEDALGYAIQDARGIERKIAADLAALTE